MKAEKDVFTFRRGDAAAAALVVLAALCMILVQILGGGSSGKAGTAKVFRNGEPVLSIPLQKDGEYTVDGAFRNVITVKDGRIAITESTCPGGDCLRIGWISHPSRSIVCLPNRVEIRIEGTADGDEADDAVDAVVR